MFKTAENKTILFHYRAKEAEKLIGFAKTHDDLSLIYWLRRTKTKPNTTAFHSCTITANIWENSKKLKRRTHVKSNLKIRNRVISSPRDENITPLRKEDESNKSKRRKNYFEISRIWTTLNKWPFWLFSPRLCSNSHEAKKCLNEANKLNKQSAWKLP